MVNHRVITAALLLLALTGCSNITEHEMAFKAGLHIISSQDFSTIKTITDMAGARSLLIYPGNVFVASTEGIIYRIDSETQEYVDEYQVAAASPAGFSDMVFCNLKNTAYLIGPLGKILEISLPDCTVIDEFAICQSPVRLALGPGSQHLFVADGPSSRVYQVAIDDNEAKGSVHIYYNINCIESSQYPDTIVVGTSEDMNIVEVLDSGSLRLTRPKLLQYYCFSAVAAIPDDTAFVAVVGSNVCLLDVFVPDEFPPPPFFSGQIHIEGDVHFVAIGNDWQHAYVLSYLGDNTSRLISYNYRFFSIDNEMDIPGYPLDLQVSGGGVIYALTTE